MGAERGAYLFQQFHGLVSCAGIQAGRGGVGFLIEGDRVDRASHPYPRFDLPVRQVIRARWQQFRRVVRPRMEHRRKRRRRSSGGDELEHLAAGEQV
ncbi:MAG: hypothetical protein BWY63_03433 [Chloroflexi bacterium ADurb.Bin360]|nr:MAG: hypothetical protein BWY63_03433 [Chloroflexi bacterium ADurb.Bin360]